MTSTRISAFELALVLGFVLVIALPVPPSAVSEGTPQTDNLSPVAEAGPNVTTGVGDLVSFDGSKSYDPDVTGGWTSGPPMPTSRGQPAGAVVGGQLFVIGGYQKTGVEGRFLDTNEV